MFGIEFFPTPEGVIEQMTTGIALDGRVVLEPSAGAGNIVSFLKRNGAREVLACELDPDLRQILAGKCNVVENDFLELTSDRVSHIDLIIANPPFSSADKHILHMWDIAPAGCEIVSLCNAETVRNPYSASRKQLATLINQHGASFELGDCFRSAARDTNINVSMIRLSKPASEDSGEFEGFFLEDDQPEQQANALMPYNFVRDLVNRYVAAVKLFDKQLDLAVEMNKLTGPFYSSKIAFTCTQEKRPVVRNDYKKDLQKEAWSYVFKKMNLQKYSTKGLREDINKFVEQQQEIPFTMRNIYRMVEIVIGTTGQRMDKALMEVFDKLTKHYSENRYGVEGWKTNSQYLLNEKFIMPWMVEIGWSGQMSLAYRGNYEIIEDLQKALCYITGTNYDTCTRLWDFIHNEKLRFGELYQWGFFEFRGYKKGTVHFKFRSRDVWAAYNQNIARILGYNLPENLRK